MGWSKLSWSLADISAFMLRPFAFADSSNLSFSAGSIRKPNGAMLPVGAVVVLGDLDMTTQCIQKKACGK